MSTKNYRDESRKNWFTTSEDPLTVDEINCGAILRIADATEKMATNHIKLQEDYNYMKKRRDYYQEEYEKSMRTVRSLKGVITKLKKKGSK